MTPELEYYSRPGELTDLGDFHEFTRWMSSDPRVIFQVVQGLIMHDMWTERYGVTVHENQKRKICTPSANAILVQIQELNDLSFALPRNPSDRVIGCCREFSLLAVALFQAKGIPARARSGFALYLAPSGFYEDHWVCEYWNGERWIAIDPQVDPFQQSVFHNYALTEEGIDPVYKQMILSLNPLDVSKQHFINAGIAWNRYRSDEVSALKFGIGADAQEYHLDSLYGAWFIRGQLLRDFAALNKIETVPFLTRLEENLDWKSWRLMSATDDELSDSDLVLLDKIASFCVDPEGQLEAMNKLFENNPDLHPLL